MNIIAFSGKRGSGKSTAADHLVEKFYARKESFAGELRGELVAGLGIDPQLIGMKPTPAHVRKLLIAYGSFRRAEDPDYWVKKVLKKIGEATVSGTGTVIIDDLRYWNEAEKLREYGAVLVRIERFNYVRKFLPGVDNDPSELDLDEYTDWHHRWYIGDGEVDYLRGLAENLLGDMMAGGGVL